MTSSIQDVGVVIVRATTRSAAQQSESKWLDGLAACAAPASHGAARPLSYPWRGARIPRTGWDSLPYAQRGGPYFL